MTRTQPEGYLAPSSTGAGPGILVLHAWWGLNDTIRSICNRLADEGFIAFAPDLYHGRIATTIPEAEAFAKAVSANHLQAEAELAEAVRFLDERMGGERKGIAVMGFSLGASFALDLAAADPAHIHSVVLYYGTGGGDWSSSRAAYLGHFAANDPFEPRAGVDELEETLKQAGRPVTFHHYPGTGHWFAEPDRTDAYNKVAADLAWTRTLEFLK